MEYIAFSFDDFEFGEGGEHCLHFLFCCVMFVERIEKSSIILCC